MYFAAYFSLITKTWDYLAYQGMIFTAASFAACYWWLPETPRFLYSKRRFEETQEVLQRMLEMNRKQTGTRYVFEKSLREEKEQLD